MDVSVSWGVSVIDGVLAVASVLSFCVCVCVCCLGGLCEHKFKGFGGVGRVCRVDYWFVVEFRMLLSYLSRREENSITLMCFLDL